MLKRDEIKAGVIWRFIEVIGAEFFSFCAFLVLTRMLAPEYFGVVALATMLIMIAQIMLFHGVGEALVQRDRVDDDYFCSALWMNFAIAAFSAAMLITTSEWIALGFAEPQFGPVLRAIAPVLLIYALSGVLQAKLRRDLRLKGFAGASIFATICAAGVATLMAVNGFEVWSLVGQQWTYATVSTLIFLVFARWVPRPFVDRDHVWALVSFGINTFGATLLRFCMRQVDLLFLGIHVQSRDVGLYFLASRILYTVGQLTYYSIQKIVLPVLSRLQNDDHHHRSAITPTFQLTCLLCLPIFLGMAVTADLAVPLIFGAEWTGSILVFQIMCVFSIFYALSLIANQVLLSVGYAHATLKLSIFNALVLLIAVAIAAQSGIAATAIAGGLANALTLPIYFVVLRRKLDVDLFRLGKDLLPIWSAAAVMVGIVILVRCYVIYDWHVVVTLALSIMLGAVSFCLAFFALNRDYAAELLMIVSGERLRSS